MDGKKIDLYRYYIYNIYMAFEWNELKNEKNRQKHGIWFEEAQMIFKDVL